MRVALIVLAAVCLSAGQAPSQAPAAPPSTEIYLASVKADGARLAIGKPENISNSPGYDNQPFFARDGRSLFFASDRTAKDSTAPGQTDIYRYDVASRRVTQVTATPEREYSPTVMPDGRHLSTIRVEADGTQRLWQFALDGSTPALVLEKIRPVGYHAWLDSRTLALFVLGEPATLQVANTTSGTAEIAATDIGPSIQVMPAGGASFVQQAGQRPNRVLTVTQVTVQNGKPAIQPLTPVVPGSTQVHHAWLPDGRLIMAHNGTLFAWRNGDAGWQPVADLAALGLTDVTRLAVSPKGERIALVAR